MAEPINPREETLRNGLFLAAIWAMALASMVANVTVGWSFGDGGLTSVVMMVVFLSSDIVKIYMPFAVAQTWSPFRPFMGVVSIGLLLVTVGFSVFSGFTFGLGDRMTRSVEGKAQTAKIGDVRAEIARIDAELAKETETRSGAEIQAQIDSILGQVLANGRTVAQDTRNCAAPRGAAQFDCEDVAFLKQGLAAAQRIDRLKTQREQYTQQSLAGYDNTAPQDTQAFVWSTVTGWSQLTVIQVVSAMMVIIMESVSLFALMIYRRLLNPKSMSDWVVIEDDTPAIGAGGVVTCPLATSAQTPPKKGLATVLEG